MKSDIDEVINSIKEGSQEDRDNFFNNIEKNIKSNILKSVEIDVVVHQFYNNNILIEFRDCSKENLYKNTEVFIKFLKNNHIQFNPPDSDDDDKFSINLKDYLLFLENK